MIIRMRMPSDDAKIQDIYRGQYQDSFQFPSLVNLISDAVVSDNDRIIAYGMVQAHAEAVMVLSSEASARDKIEALKKLMQYGVLRCAKLKYDQMHIFVEPEFAAILKKHFGFEQAKGECLVLNL